MPVKNFAAPAAGLMICTANNDQQDDCEFCTSLGFGCIDSYRGVCFSEDAAIAFNRKQEKVDQKT